MISNDFKLGNLPSSYFLKDSNLILFVPKLNLYGPYLPLNSFESFDEPDANHLVLILSLSFNFNGLVSNEFYNTRIYAYSLLALKFYSILHIFS